MHAQSFMVRQLPCLHTLLAQRGSGLGQEHPQKGLMLLPLKSLESLLAPCFRTAKPTGSNARCELLLAQLKHDQGALAEARSIPTPACF